MNLDYIITNEGATLDHHGQVMTFNDGYMVSSEGRELVVPLNNLTTETLNIILSGYKKEILLHNEYIGLWIDDGNLYFDISQHISTYTEAINVGRRNNQKAIYDCFNNQSIYLEGSN